MASGDAAPGAVQTVVLRVSIHCQGCKKKVRKVLKNVEGVHNVTVDGAAHKVTVTGTVDADTLVKRLYKSGKQAVPWQWRPPAAADKKPEAAAAEAQPAGDGGKDAAAAAAADKKPEEPVKEPQAESSEKKPEQETGASEKKPDAEKITETEKEEAKPSDKTKKNDGASEAAEPKAKNAEPAKEAVAPAAKDVANEEDGAKKSKNNEPKGGCEAEPAVTVERSLSSPPMAAPKHAYEEYSYPYNAPQPVLSYHMAQPSASQSYYAPQPQPAYSVQQAQAQSMPDWSPSYLHMPYQQHSAPESYYHDYYSPPGTHASPPLQDSYRIFDDENPNSCSVM
ncbi:heavy metal-associated isoprenylated plant protein 35-like [Phragmites australis]|uniref:heavy metal-associated isoprenylated plant protein 35-like n=1 Tax=Phragmites australis TaxID=29695 RepID=UPI002D766655|nr:heavy metal-associated isoprenylated plant protein 35-like [Phragmites australis]